MLDNSEIIKNKLFLIESILVEGGSKYEIKSELDEINVLLASVYGDERDWIISKIDEIEKEMIGHHDSKNESFFRGNNEKLDSYLSITLDNLSSLKEQRQHLNRAQIGLDRGSNSIGSGIEYLKKLKDRHEKDFKMMMCGFLFLLAIVVFIWLFSK